ncbi:XrtA/PEP-CTERM system exopolysaccharide export protein [Pelagibius marinus]|uniref:XrtA/PEP-CTERM system exopolysaccharide export protein n=1 Tax=Pelagibius marinus TaxID=2762760 RepID=UPI00187274E7|nr:XrtA/PEP-CTERM system exopolysaccharide export protein [Pelagibius marinus]
MHGIVAKHWRAFSLLLGLLAHLLIWMLGPLAQAAPAEPPTYLIGPGDALEITVWRQPELSTAVTVRPDGRISIPLVEDLPAAGKTPMELADAIEARLSPYLQDPLVLVTVGSGLGDLGQQIRIVGDAVEPMAIAYRSGITLLDAIIAAGGLSRQADGNAAVILRRSEDGRREIPVRLADLVREGDSTANTLLSPGDVIVIPKGFFTGEWHVTYGASASQTFSDNIDQGPSGDREAGFVTRAGPNISIRGETARVTVGLNGSLAGVQQIGGDDEGVSLDPRINGTSKTEVLQDLMFFDLRAAISRQLLDSRQSTSTSGASIANRDLVATLTASPYVVHRLGDVANVEWRYSFSPVLVDAGNRSDVFSHEGSLTVDSGSAFRSFSWTWTNRGGEEVRSQNGDITTASTDFGARYTLWQGFSLLGGIGYEYRDGDGSNDNNFDGMTWRVGFDWFPHPDLDLQATYGRRQDDESIDASLYYRLGPKTTLRASYAEALQTSQQRAIANLGRLVIDPITGELVDEATGQPFREDELFTFEDATTRTRTFRLNAEHRSGRNTFRLSGLAGTSEGGSAGDEEFYRVNLAWGRPLSSTVDLTASGGYQRSDFQDEDRTDDTFNANLGLTYQLSSNARAFASYGFQVRDSSASDESFVENAVTVGVTISF